MVTQAAGKAAPEAPGSLSHSLCRRFEHKVGQIAAEPLSHYRSQVSAVKLRSHGFENVCILSF